MVEQLEIDHLLSLDKDMFKKSVEQIIQKFIHTADRPYFLQQLQNATTHHSLRYPFLKNLERYLREQKEKFKEDLKRTLEEAFTEVIAEMEKARKILKEYEDECNYCITTCHMFHPSPEILADLPEAGEELGDLIMEEYDQHLMDLEALEEELGIDLDRDMEVGESEEHKDKVFRSKTLKELETAISHAKKSSVDEMVKSMSDFISLIKSITLLKDLQMTKGYLNKEYKEKIQKIMAQDLERMSTAQLIPLVYFGNVMGVPISFRDVFEKNYSALASAFNVVLNEIHAMLNKPLHIQKESMGEKGQILRLKVSRLGKPEEAEKKVLEMFNGDARVAPDGYIEIDLTRAGENKKMDVKDILNMLSASDIIVERFYIL